MGLHPLFSIEFINDNHKLEFKGGSECCWKEGGESIVEKVIPNIFIILEPHCQFNKVDGFWKKLSFVPLEI